MIHLTPREKETLLLVGEGYSDMEIARRMVIKYRTVQKNIEKIREKAGLCGNDPVWHGRVLLARLADQVRAEDKKKADQLSNQFAARLVASRQATAEEVA